ncbi:hypothetical protein [Haloferula rosea]|uniref:Uncharacterized protein n=1 Tax=Haloferula rosea TaxID=490093 RepID=A0A934VH47_9BACT|nr:hypothetical protein [Haloferula rosea]MBK1828706.1 hypothetical protein [Haloferula rosea]
MKIPHSPSLSVLLLTSSSAFSQAVYNYTGIEHNNEASRWNVASNWDEVGSPGDLLNGTSFNDDDVRIRNNRVSNHNVRLQVDAGEISKLAVGGQTATGSTLPTELHLREDTAALRVAELVTIGGLSFDGGSDLAGAIALNRGSSTLTVRDVVSGSNHGANFITVTPDDQTATPTVFISGNMDTAGVRADATDAFAIDYIVNRTDGFVLNGSAPQTLNVEVLQVLVNGSPFGNASGIPNHAVTYTLGDGDRVNGLFSQVAKVNNSSRHYEGTLRVVGGATCVIRGGGAMQLGVTANSSTTNNDTASAKGSLEVGNAVGPGTVIIGGQLQVGRQEENNGTNTQLARGAVVVDHPASRLACDSLVLGDVAGDPLNTSGRSDGVLTIDDGTVTVGVAQVDFPEANINGGSLFIAGAAVDDTDFSAVGIVNLNGGILQVTGGNTEVGRGGQGFFNINGGRFDQLSSNLVIGQSTTSRLSDGTVVMAGGDVNIGNFDGTADSDININADGGTFLQFAGTVDVESDINMAEDFKPCAYRISGGTLIVGENVLARGGTGLDALEVSGAADVVIGGRVFFNSTNNLLKMTGAACSLAIQGIGQTGAEVLDLGSATATLEFEFVDGSVSPVRVEAAAGNLIDLRNCQLALGGDLPESGSHLLLENVNGCYYLGNFAGLGEGETVELGDYVYAISYLGGDGDDVELTKVGDVDFDGDDIPKWYEEANGLSDNDAGDAATDPDGDGMDALSEYMFGTAENDRASTFFLEVASIDETTITFRFGPRMSGRVLTLRGMPGLAGYSGPSVVFGPSDQSIAVQEFTLPITHSRNFYRIEATLP